MDAILSDLGELLGGLWSLLEGFRAVFGAMLRPFWRPWGAPEAILRCFGRVSEVSEAILQVSRGFYSVFTGLHLCYKFTEVFTVCSPRWRAKRAPLASEASCVGERSELRWRAKRALCGLLFLASSLLNLLVDYAQLYNLLYTLSLSWTTM